MKKGNRKRRLKEDSIIERFDNDWAKLYGDKRIYEM